MKIKLKNNVGSEWKNDDYNKTLISLRGEWVEVDTTHLFNDQYNLLDYNIRVFDRMVEAVQDDARQGACKCGYCGKTFFNVNDLNAHYLEVEEKAHKCDGCFWYRSHIIDTKRENEKTTDENGRVIEKSITTYLWEKQCSRDNGCDRFEHRNYKPNYFTPENTYFLRYPNGYEYYFNSLTLTEQWRELGYIYDADAKTATLKNVSGTYNAVIHFDNNNILEKLVFQCSRKCFTLSKEELLSIVSKRYSICYLLRFDNDTKREKELLQDVPKTRKKEIETYLENLQITYMNNGIRKRLFFGGVENE